MNWTWPGRAHIITNPKLIYLTLWVFDLRMHYCKVRRRIYWSGSYVAHCLERATK